MHVRGNTLSTWVFTACALSGAALCAIGFGGCSTTDEGGSGAQSNVVRIRGSVVDADGNPIANVRVESESGTTMTSGSGAFEVEVPTGGPAVLIFRHEGYVRGLERLDVSSGGDVPLFVTMVRMADPIPFDSSQGGEVVGMRGATMKAIPTKNPKLEMVCHAETMRLMNPSESATDVRTSARPTVRSAVRTAPSGSSPLRRRCR